MNFKVISTGSKGNCYLLTASNGEVIALDAGVSFDVMKKNAGGSVMNMSILLTHIHGDHSKGVKKAINYGVDIYSSAAAFESLGLTGHYRTNHIEPNQGYTIGSFFVSPFWAKHNVPCYGFLVWHPECGTILYLTDTAYIETVFKGVKINHFVIEANYDFDIVQDRVFDRRLDTMLANRVLHDHLDIDGCERVLANQDMSEVENIVLVHLSEGNGNPVDFQNRITRKFGRPTVIAKPGLELDFTIQ